MFRVNMIFFSLHSFIFFAINKILHCYQDLQPLSAYKINGYSGVILELSEREKFCDNFRIWGRSFGPNFGFPYNVYILYIFTSPSAQDREKSASLGRLFPPNRPLGWPLGTIEYLTVQEQSRRFRWDCADAQVDFDVFKIFFLTLELGHVG